MHSMALNKRPTCYLAFFDIDPDCDLVRMFVSWNISHYTISLQQKQDTIYGATTTLWTSVRRHTQECCTQTTHIQQLVLNIMKYILKPVKGKMR